MALNTPISLIIISAVPRQTTYGQQFRQFRRQSYEGQFVVTKAKPRADVSAANRSAVTNGKRLFVAGGDLRGPWARRFKDVVHLHLSDLGGPTAVSESENSLVRRVAVLTIELEKLEARFSADPDVDIASLDAYQRGVNSLRRLLETLAAGLSRRPKDVSEHPTYLAVEYENDTTDKHN